MNAFQSERRAHPIWAFALTPGCGTNKLGMLGGQEDRAIGYRYIICFLIFLGYVLVFFHRLCPAVIALDIQESFGISGTLLGVLGSAYFYSYAFMQVPTGLMADSWGPRKTVSAFFVLAGTGAILMGIAPNPAFAILGRVLVGIGVSTVFVCNFKLLAEWFTPRQFVIMGGIFMAMGGMGALSSSAPLAWISGFIGWRVTLVAVGIVTLVLAVLIYAFVRNRPEDMGLAPINVDIPGALERKLGLWEGMKLVVRSGRFWPISIWSFFATGISFALGGLWGGPYLIHVYGMNKTQAGAVLSMFAMALIFGSPLLSWSANRVGRKPVLTGCSLLLIGACGVLFAFTGRLSLPAMYGLFFSLSLSGAAAGPIVAAVSKELFPLAISGTSVGIVNLFPFMGAAFFQILIGAVLSGVGKEDIVLTLCAYQKMFLICLMGALISMVAAFLLRETLRHQKGIF
jgi:sugar phosphate permease